MNNTKLKNKKIPKGEWSDIIK